MSSLRPIFLLVLLSFAPSAPAQSPHGPHNRPPEPAFMAGLFPPELVMRHQAQIELNAEQRDAIKAAVEELQSSVLDLQWQVSAGQTELGERLDPPRVDEKTALAQVDQILQAENQIKRQHLRMLIRIKNQLTPDQQAQLRDLRSLR